MSASLYVTGLWWGHGHGTAKLHGHAVTLVESLMLAGQQVYYIAYAPEVGMIRVCMWGAHERDMTREEISAADALLSALCK